MNDADWPLLSVPSLFACKSDSLAILFLSLTHLDCADFVLIRRAFPEVACLPGFLTTVTDFVSEFLQGVGLYAIPDAVPDACYFPIYVYLSSNTRAMFLKDVFLS